MYFPPRSFAPVITPYPITFICSVLHVQLIALRLLLLHTPPPFYVRWLVIDSPVPLVRSPLVCAPSYPHHLQLIDSRTERWLFGSPLLVDFGSPFFPGLIPSLPVRHLPVHHARCGSRSPLPFGWFVRRSFHHHRSYLYLYVPLPRILRSHVCCIVALRFAAPLRCRPFTWFARCG